MIELHDIGKVEATAVSFTEFGESSQMTEHLRVSDKFIAVYWDSGFLGLFGGLRPMVLMNIGYIWFAETPLLAEHKTPFIRASRNVRDMLLAHYDELVGISFEARSCAWLRWMGAVFGPQLENGAHPFVIRRAEHG